MISGVVVSNQGPIVPLVLRDSGGREWIVNAVVDTGFNNWLTLPRHLIDGQPQVVSVEELDSEPLVGMRLLHGFRYSMDAVDGGAVQIERLP